jgi:UDPglucose 6-dehydrogenase
LVSSEQRNMNVSVIGLGKLGSPMAAVFAARGHHVVGLDVNRASLSALEAGRAPVEEPRLQEMIEAGKGRLRVTAEHAELARSSDVTFIIVPTPSDATGAFSNEHVIAAIEKLGAALRAKSGYHVVAVTSTVMPGSTGGPVCEALERASGRRVGDDVGLCYNPEFIALGSVIDNMLKPDFLLIGESDPRAGELVAAVYELVCENRPTAHRMNFVNAELAKIAVNTFVTTKISYANMLADMCDRLPGADIDVVTEAVGSDSRIGRRYLRGALGYGGPCFPRDNIAFAALATQLGARPDIAKATEAINSYQVERLARAVAARVPRGACVAVLGMSYKPDTAVIEESQGVLVARRLLEDGYSIVIHDPVAGEPALRVLGSPISLASSAEDALAHADFALITTPWPQYAGLWRTPLARTVHVVDCWRILPRDARESSLRPIWLGRGEDISTDALARS